MSIPLVHYLPTEHRRHGSYLKGHQISFKAFRAKG
jgi:hypothetical protein